jgi:hypothetical protein
MIEQVILLEDGTMPGDKLTVYNELANRCQQAIALSQGMTVVDVASFQALRGVVSRQANELSSIVDERRSKLTSYLDALKERLMIPEKRLQAVVEQNKKTLLEFSRNEELRKREVEARLQREREIFQAAERAWSEYFTHADSLLKVLLRDELPGRVRLYFANAFSTGSQVDLTSIGQLFDVAQLYHDFLASFGGEDAVVQQMKNLNRTTGEPLGVFEGKLNNRLTVILAEAVGTPNERRKALRSRMSAERRNVLLDLIEEKVRAYLQPPQEMSPEPIVDAVTPEPVDAPVTDENTREALELVEAEFARVESAFRDQIDGIRGKCVARVTERIGWAEALIFYLRHVETPDEKKLASGLDFVLKFVAKHQAQIPGVTLQKENVLTLSYKDKDHVHEDA